MAHYAYLDENNIVVIVIVGKDETELIGQIMKILLKMMIKGE